MKRWLVVFSAVLVAATLAFSALADPIHVGGGPMTMSAPIHVGGGPI